MKTTKDRFKQMVGRRIMTDCERHGMNHGCTIDCPALLNDECEFQETDNKELYEEAQKNGSWVKE